MKNFYTVTLLVVSLFTSACTGTGYKLPDVTAEEAAVIEERIQSDGAELKVYRRSDDDYKIRLATISKRLQKSAKPLCEQAEYHPCHFDVMYNNEMVVNAYAHDEYKITVFKGMLQYLKNNEEVAALVAHEMGHHLAKHNQETRQNAETGAVVAGVFTTALILMANSNNPYYDTYQQMQDQQAIENMMVAGAGIGGISYSKEQEREADLLAVYLLEYAGYDLQKAQGLMYKLARMPSDDVEIEGKAALLDTHPPSSKRYVAWEKAIEEVGNSDTKLPVPVSQNKAAPATEVAE